MAYFLKRDLMYSTINSNGNTTNSAKSSVIKNPAEENHAEILLSFRPFFTGVRIVGNSITHLSLFVNCFGLLN